MLTHEESFFDFNLNLGVNSGYCQNIIGTLNPSLPTVQGPAIPNPQIGVRSLGGYNHEENQRREKLNGSMNK